MGCEDQLHHQPFERLLNLLCTKTEIAQALDRSADRFTERFRIAPLLAAAEHTDAVAILGDIGEIEVHAERTGHGAGCSRFEVLDFVRERAFGRWDAGPAVARNLAN